jgi:hypothetical protein
MSSGLSRALDTLESLQRSLTLAIEAPLKHSSNWTDDVATARMVKAVRERHDGPGKSPDTQTLAMAVARYRLTGEPEGWRGLKRVCYGAGLVDQNGWSIIGDDSLLADLLLRAESQESSRKEMKCYQALLSAYFSFRIFQADAKTQAGWMKLREWLGAKLWHVTKYAGRLPSWLITLVEHENLLREGACDRYGPELLAGYANEFKAVLTAIGIPSDSWVPEEAIFAQIRAATSLSDEGFREILPAILSVACGNAGMEPTRELRMRSVGLLLSRYALISGTPLDMQLRDAAVEQIGNPWVKKAVWDAVVLASDGSPDNAAREMVGAWMKRRLITDFFDILTGDGRRLDYWMRFEPYIEDMWFALGVNARLNHSEEFRNFRGRATGRLLNLDGTTSGNNAFVMRMGEYLAVEFGEEGNEFYLFKTSELHESLSQKLLSGKDSVEIGIHLLRNGENAVFRGAHSDISSSLISWEQKFDEVICPLIGITPKERAAFVPDLESIIKFYEVKGQDLRDKGGALWVLANNTQAALNEKLLNLGFAYRVGKGWWKS